MIRFKNKFLLCTLIFVCIYIINLNVFATNQIDLFNNFANESWKSKQIAIEGKGNKTIEQHIVDAFNNTEWNQGIGNKKINQNLNEDIIAYYRGDLHDFSSNNNYDPQNPEQWTNTLTANDSPRQWMRNLNLREIYKFNDLISQNQQLIDNRAYATDDLIKAIVLSGTFWIVDTETEVAMKAFSGMLVPGQELTYDTHLIHTCMHGFSYGNGTDNIEYYFVPFGVMVTADNSDDDDYVTKKGFKVVSICQGSTRNWVQINDHKFSRGSVDISADNLYSQNDYAMVEIKNRTTNNVTLKQILIDINSDLANNTMRLPSINTDDNMFDSRFTENDERLFVIGYTQYPDLAWNGYEIAISTTLTNNNYCLNRCKRSVKNDENTKQPSKIEERTNEYYSSLASFPGISGGAVLRCKLDPDNASCKKCTVIGTNWGAERTFDDQGRLLEFKNIINKIDEGIKRPSKQWSLCNIE